MKSDACPQYIFVSSFAHNLYKNTGIVADEDILAYIKMVCETYTPYRKIDNKGRPSEYFTTRLNGVLITIVCDSVKKRIITAVIETHSRPQFANL